MRYNLTSRRIDILRSALCTYEVEYEDCPSIDGFTSEEEREKELHAIFQWLNQQQNKKGK